MPTVMDKVLEVKGLQCSYDGQPVVSEVSFHLHEGEIACLLGPSGCGKTTVLRALAGFNAVEGGEIELYGRVLSASGVHLPPEQRRIGMVFQDYALFPHLTVAQNIAFGLKGLSRKDADTRVSELLSLVQLEGKGQRYPHELSGGQQQRVALARALAPRPDLLLMDEPFSNLDTDLRRHLAREVREILKQQGIPAVLVTHDQEEAFAFSDKVGVLAEGRLHQWDSPYNLYYSPSSPRVAAFVGKGEFIPGTVRDGLLCTDVGNVMLTCNQWQDGDEVQLFVRPHEIVPADAEGAQAQILAKEFLGTTTLYTLQLSSGRLVSSAVDSHIDLQVGDAVTVSLQPPRPVTFAAA